MSKVFIAFVVVVVMGAVLFVASVVENHGCMPWQTAVTTGGVFIGGGVAPRLLPALENGRFVQAFNDKGPMRPMLEQIPVSVILNPETALLGAAVYANGML